MQLLANEKITLGSWDGITTLAAARPERCRMALVAWAWRGGTMVLAAGPRRISERHVIRHPKLGQIAEAVRCVFLAC
jgi:hypothetical protein